PTAIDTAQRLESEGRLTRRKSMLHSLGRESPHRAVDIRSASGSLFAIVDQETGGLLGTVDESRAFFHVHPGAVYLHQGEQYELSELDLAGRVALVGRSQADFYTQVRDRTDIEVLD